jgi:hypothetical protein
MVIYECSKRECDKSFDSIDEIFKHMIGVHGLPGPNSRLRPNAYCYRCRTAVNDINQSTQAFYPLCDNCFTDLGIKKIK